MEEGGVGKEGRTEGRKEGKKEWRVWGGGCKKEGVGRKGMMEGEERRKMGGRR